ncbi:hypothetical protein EES42_03730 [Streptomyces sp. ADI95-17]|nr:hypothetical protein EES42_03730 [Streptomyces sp. ADI95-17]
MLFSDVPVLPAASYAEVLAARPEPASTTPVRTEVTVSADLRLITWLPMPSTGSTVRSRCLADFTMNGVTFLPWLSSVAYAPAMSQVEAFMVPSVMAGRSGKFLSGTPRASAVFFTAGGPTSTTICAKAELIDAFIAFCTVTLP